MKKLLLFCLFVLMASVTMVSAQSGKWEMSFQGIVLKMSPDLGVLSGDIPSYRLIKYKVEKVFEGEYDQKEIVVDHLILTGKELKKIKVGDKVFVRVFRYEKINLRYNAEGIRHEDESVLYYYIANRLSKSRE